MAKEKKTYVVLEFAGIFCYYDKTKKYAIGGEKVVEVAAVKITRISFASSTSNRCAFL